jgi:hypothetical protein
MFGRSGNIFGSWASEEYSGLAGRPSEMPVRPPPQCWRKAGDAWLHHSTAIVLANLGWIA